jgi:hypothetical protein
MNEYDKHRNQLLENISHDVWGAAQLLPGEGVEDGVARIMNTLDGYITLFEFAIRIKATKEGGEMMNALNDALNGDRSKNG